VGRHISQVKAINTGTHLWYAHELQLMQKMGNRRAERLYLAQLPSDVQKPQNSAPAAQKMQWVKDKYERVFTTCTH
jgi:hypothetical protein